MFYENNYGDIQMNISLISLMFTWRYERYGKIRHG